MLSLSFKHRKFYQNTNDVAYHQFIHIIYGKLAFINFPFALKTEYQIKIKINRIKNRESLQLLLSKKKERFYRHVTLTYQGIAHAAGSRRHLSL